MKALTVWQPWASLIIAGFKPFEFRKWDFTTRPALRALIGQRIVIHAASRPMDPYWPARLKHDTPGMELVLTCLCGDPQGAHDWLRAGRGLPLGAGLGTVVLGKTFAPPGPDMNCAWPMLDPVAWERPIPARGAQGFWTWPEFAQAAGPEGGAP